jgi:hypothetical protein
MQDIGFDGIGSELGFDNNVFNKYFDDHIPRAVRNVPTTPARSTSTSSNSRSCMLQIELASWARQNLSDKGFIWTTQPYLLSMFLECPEGMGLHCPAPPAVLAVEESIRRGDISWHALPHNSQVPHLHPCTAAHAARPCHTHHPTRAPPVLLDGPTMAAAPPAPS